MTGRAARGGLLAVTLACLPAASLGACGGCGAGPVATLEEARGDVDRDRLGALERWDDAAVGDRFAIGEALRTGADARALVGLRGGSRARLEPDTVVRFLAEAPGAPEGRVSLEAGEAELEVAADETLFAALSLGTARIEGGSRVRLTRDDDGSVRLRVAVGLARVERRRGGAVEVAADEAVRVTARDVTAIGRDGEAALDAGSDAATTSAPDPASDPAPDPAPAAVTARTERGRASFRGADDDGWSELPDDAEVPLVPGTLVRVASRGRAVLRRGGDVVHLDAGAEARVGRGDGPLVELDRGGAHAQSAARDVEVQVPGGLIVLRGGGGGSEADLDVGRRRSEARVVRGAVEVRPANGPAATLSAGQSATVAPSGTVDAPPPPPRRAHVVVTAGESGTFHDAAGPPVVAIALPPACAEGAVVETDDQVVPGTGRVNVRLRRAAQDYAVRCLEGGAVAERVAARGTLRWSRRSGAARLPRRPPRNVLDADGLRYTVLYQTLLPELVLRWREAPATGPFTLVVEGGANERVRLSSARHRFPSGALGEGSYTFRFVAGGGAASPTSSLRIAFDNATASAYLRRPPATGRIRGDTVRVSGAALPGATVSVGGRVLPLDGQRRFDAEVPVPADVDAVAIRIAHPRTGLHHYLRRIARDPSSP